MNVRTRQLSASAAPVTLLVVVALAFSGILAERPSVLFANVAQLLAPLAAAVGCWSARHRSVAAADRRAWTFLAWAASAWGLGQAIWTGYEWSGIASPYPSAADLGFLLAIPLALVGVWALSPRESTSARAVAVVDGLIIAGSLVAICWPLVLAPMWEDGHEDTIDLALSLAYPVGSLVVASSALLAVVRSRRGGVMPVGTLALSFVAWGFADSAFVWQAADGSARALGAADLGWMLSFVVLLVAAVRYPVGGGQVAGGVRGAVSVRRALLPLTVAGVALVVRGALAADGYEADRVLSVVTVAVAALILARHVMTMWENQVLTNDLEEKILELTRREEQLTHQAFHDPLTGLANRRLFGDRVEHALERSRRTGERTAVLFIDLDDFKTVNDSLGHAAGDRLLVAVASRVSGCVRPGDTVARLGGDEFGILLEELDVPDQAAVVAARILDALDVPFPLDGRQVFTRASIGVANAELSEDPLGDHLLVDADVALYAAKAAGKATYRQFEGAMRSTAVERLELSQDLRRGVEARQFICHYQPIIDLATGNAVAVEALVRWQHPTRGLLEPDAFVGLAEEIGVIDAIGLHVLHESADQMSMWRSTGAVPSDLELHVNLSGRQLDQPDLARRVHDVLAAAGLPADQLVLEITESVAVDLATHHQVRLQELRAVGVRLAVDDFGAGYSSLSYLRNLPVDVLKVDRVFASPAEGTTDLVLLEAIVRLGHALEIEVVAEGIEHPDQVDVLVDLGCQRAQGFLFSRPVPGELLPAVVTDRVWRRPHPATRPGPRTLPRA